MQALFRNYGDTVLPHLRPHLERLIVEDGTESAQRCASELMAALVRGSKHWTFEMTEELWAWLSPLVRKALEKVRLLRLTQISEIHVIQDRVRD